MTISSIPNDCIIDSLGWLDKPDLVASSLVDKSWHALCKGDRLWQILAEKEFPGITASKTENAVKIIKDYFALKLMSNNAIIDKFSSFLRVCTVHKKSRSGFKEILVSVTALRNTSQSLHNEFYLCENGVGEGTLKKYEVLSSSSALFNDELIFNRDAIEERDRKTIKITTYYTEIIADIPLSISSSPLGKKIVQLALQKSDQSSFVCKERLIIGFFLMTIFGTFFFLR